MRRRRFFNFLVKPGAQLKELMAYMSFFILISGSFAFVFGEGLKRYIMSVISVRSVLYPEVIDESLANLSITIMSLVSIFVLLLSLYFIKATHRFYGPVYAIKRYLRASLDGESVGKIKLRENDHLHEVAEKINRIQESHSKPTKEEPVES